MQGLMHFCLNWGDQDCDSNVGRFAQAKEMGPGNDIVIWPYGTDLMQYDEICRSCSHRLFEIEENWCIVCENEDIQYVESGKLEQWPESKLAHFYLCSNCDSRLASRTKLRNNSA